MIGKFGIFVCVLIFAGGVALGEKVVSESVDEEGGYYISPYTEISPAGDKMAIVAGYNSGMDGGYKDVPNKDSSIYILDLKTKDLRVVPGSWGISWAGFHSMQWNSDGSILYYRLDRMETKLVEVVEGSRISDGKITKCFSYRSRWYHKVKYGSGPFLSPDNKYMLFNPCLSRLIDKKSPFSMYQFDKKRLFKLEDDQVNFLIAVEWLDSKTFYNHIFEKIYKVTLDNYTVSEEIYKQADESARIAKVVDGGLVYSLDNKLYHGDKLLMTTESDIKQIVACDKYIVCTDENELYSLDINGKVLHNEWAGFLYDIRNEGDLEGVVDEGYFYTISECRGHIDKFSVNNYEEHETVYCVHKCELVRQDQKNR